MKKDKLIKMFVDGHIDSGLYHYICGYISDPKNGGRGGVVIEPKNTTLWNSILWGCLCLAIGMFMFLVLKTIPGINFATSLNTALCFIISLISLFLASRAFGVTSNTSRFYSFYDDLRSILDLDRLKDAMEMCKNMGSFQYGRNIVLCINKVLTDEVVCLIKFEARSPEGYYTDPRWERIRESLNRRYTKAVLRFPELDDPRGWGRYIKSAKEIVEKEKEQRV